MSTALSVEHGIGVRDGKFCAHQLVDVLLADTPVIAASTAVRASVRLANRPEHIDRLVRAVRSLATTGPALDYLEGPGGWAPENDPRALEPIRPW